jgi:hypothetical protein
MSLNTLNSAYRARGSIRSIVRDELSKERPLPRLATVQSVDYANQRCAVQYPDEPGVSFSVACSVVMPAAAGDVVRLGGRRGSRYVEAIISGAGHGEGTYTPVLTASTTSPTLGPGSTVSGQFWKEDRWITAEFRITFGTSGVVVGSGTYAVSLPVAPTAAHLAWAVMGEGYIVDSSTGAHPPCVFRRNNTGNTVQIVVGSAGVAGHAVPMTWSTLDSIYGRVRYRHV